MEKLQDFYSYLIKKIPNSAQKYESGARVTFKEMLFKFGINKNLEDFSTLELKEFIYRILDDKSFRVKDLRGKQMYSCSLDWYIRFLDESSDKNIKMERPIMNETKEREATVLDTSELNIQPEASILEVFSRLSYKIWYAIAEFVDNSTQSFYSNEVKLKENGITSATIIINYNYEEGILTVEDNAYGMNLEDFTRAIRLDSKPKTQGSRNEFGMGLKTAASWFGNFWSVESSEYGSKKKYYAAVDIDKLKNEKLNTVPVKTTNVTEDLHGTKIVIKKITKRIFKTSLSKTKALLSSMYRRDLLSGKINIVFNGEQLKYVQQKCITYQDKVWEKKLDFNFDFDGIKHHVKGFVGILEKGGYDKAGFNLFRRNRVIIGGDLEGLNYKPKQIFIQRQSQVSLKLFGELDLDDFPVNQAKDGFIWDDGLEDTFITELQNNIQEYIRIAKKSRKELVDEDDFSEEKSLAVQNKAKNLIENMGQEKIAKIENKVNTELSTQEEKEFDTFLQNSNNSESIKLGTKREYPIKLDSVNNYTLFISWESGNSDCWIRTNKIDNFSCDVVINVNHPFFKPYILKPEFQVVIEQFVAAYTLSIEMSRRDAGTEEKIIPEVITLKLNKYLKRLGDK